MSYLDEISNHDEVSNHDEISNHDEGFRFQPYKHLQLRDSKQNKTQPDIIVD